MSGSGAILSYTYTHNLGYIPSVKSWYKPSVYGSGLPSDAWYVLTTSQLSNKFTSFLTAIGHVYVTTTSVVILLNNLSGGNISIPIKIRVYLDS
jgi:hypothetical protein